MSCLHVGEMADSGTGTNSDRETARIEPGTLIDSFRVTRLIGHGAMGQVYLGRDEQLGRRVALKVIHPRHLGSDQARERFLAEARTAAKFSHPNIVTVYAVGQHQGQPYLAMEYLEGQNLRQRLREESSQIEPLRVGLAVAEALAEAHRHGVVHRDLKPENIVIPQDGRPRVLDFGLASPTGTQLDEEGGDPKGREEGEGENRGNGRNRARRGTPAYMAPEQWRRGECSPASDIWALGVLLHELLLGERPFADHETSLEGLALRVSDTKPVTVTNDLHDVQQPLGELISECLEKDPARRPLADGAATRLRKMLVRDLDPDAKEHCPYPGLQPFTEGQAPLFYGREPEIDAFLERLRGDPVLPVVGPSGAGKSSFVRAGVIPRLRERTRWIVISLDPGKTPYLALGSALATLHRASPPGSKATITGLCGETWLDWDAEIDTAQRPSRESDDGRSSQQGDSAERLAEGLEATPGMLGQQLRHIAEREKARVLLFVDQLEELYTLVDDEDTRRSFMEMLCVAADDPRDPVRVIFTLRDDFLGRLAEGERVRQTLSRVTLLRSPGPAALEEILTKPLSAVGYRFEPSALARRMVEAVKGEGVSLPLIQFTARLLWDHRDKEHRLLTEERYEALGGVEGALAEHADGVLEGMTPRQVGLAREVLLKLITPQGTRRIVSRAEILSGLGDDGAEVLLRLTEARLVSVRRSLTAKPDAGSSDVGTDEQDADPSGGHSEDESAVLALAHESLIRGWQQLSRWFDEGREDLAFLSQVNQAAELWEARGQREDEVWAGEALADALRDARRLRQIPQLIQDFLEAGEERERRTARRRRGVLITVITLLALVALVSTLGSVALARKEEEARTERALAEEARQRAEEQGAEALREGARAAFLRGDYVQARAMLRASLEAEVSPLGQALWWRLVMEPLQWRQELSGDLDAIAFSPDGQRIAAVCDVPAVFVFELDDMSQRTLRGHRQKPDDVAFSPDGRWLASTSSEGALRIWDLDAPSAEPAVEIEDGGGPIAFAPDGSALVTGHHDGLVRLWSFPVASDDRPSVLNSSEETRSPISAIAYNATSELVAATSMDGRARIWSSGNGELIAELQVDDAPLLAVAFHPAGELVATGSGDASVRLWHLQRLGQPVATLRHSDAVRAISFSTDGETLAAGTAAGTVHLWDASTQLELERIDHGPGQVLSLAFDPVGSHLATGGTDGALRLWTLGATFDLGRERGHTAAVLGVAFSPDGALLATGSNDQTVRLWEVATGDQRAMLTGTVPARMTGVTFVDDGRRLAAASSDGSIRQWDVATGRQHQPLVGPAWFITAVTSSPAGQVLATASYDGAVRLWDQNSSAPPRVLYRHEAWATDVAFSRDAGLLASSSHDGSVRTWNFSREGEGPSLRDLPGDVHGLSLSPDGRVLAFTVGQEPAQLWFLDQDEREAVGPGDSNTYWLSFHPDGRRLGLPRADGTARIVDLRSRESVVLVGHRNEVNYIRFSPSGDLAATTSDDGTVRLWHVDSGRPVWWVPALLEEPPHYYSQRGWRALEGTTIPQGSTVQPAWRTAVEGARRAAEAPSNGIACIATFDGRLELWSTAEDERIRHEPLPDIDGLVALDEGCATLASGVARFHEPEGTTEITGLATALALGSDRQLLIATDGEIQVFSVESREIIARHGAGNWVTAILPLDRGVVLGFGDGGLEVLGFGRSTGRAQLSFESLPASAPVAMAAGPQETLVAGFQNGMVGLWSLVDGSLLYRFRLHGPALHMRVTGESLQVVTELGDTRALDLGTLMLDECELLRDLWEQVPVIWDDGVLVRGGPPGDHGCMVDP